MAEPAKKPDLGLLEEDDEFEEFPAEGILKYCYYTRVFLFWICRHPTPSLF